MSGCQKHRPLPHCSISSQVQVAVNVLLGCVIRCGIRAQAALLLMYADLHAVSTCRLGPSPDPTSSASCSHVSVLQAAIACGRQQTVFKCSRTSCCPHRQLHSSIQCMFTCLQHGMQQRRASTTRQLNTETIQT